MEKINPVIIGIAGGTGSGKSTFTDRIKARFKNQVTVIYHDNYYKCRDDISFEERKLINYDEPQALETDLLVEHLKALKNGITIQCPVYDFSQHNRSDKYIEISPSKVILIEGILVMTDERLRDMMDIKVFVDADADERILRRVQRDVKERGRDIDNIKEQYLNTVKKSHYRYVEPYKREADVIINSGQNPVAFGLFETAIEKILNQ